jgi:ribosomal protein L22
MSAEEDTTGSTPPDVAGQEPAETSAEKPAAAKKAAEESKPAKARKAPTAERKPAAAKRAKADEQAADGEQQAAKKPAAKRAAAKKAAPAKEPVAESADAESKPAGGAKPGAKPTARRKVVHAHARYVRTSARKARMVCGHLRGKSVEEARAILAFTPREVARDWSKLLESAVANAENNHELLEDDLVVREAYADEGPTIKRFRPRAMGRATPIRKRTSHLTITLTPRPEPGTTKRHG